MRHLRELIHAESAQVLATYRDDFYAGRPAVTVNRVGKGKAWHVASRNDLPFQRDFFAGIINELLYRAPSRGELPPGVVATARTDAKPLGVLQNHGTAAVHHATHRVYRLLHDRRRCCGRYRSAAWDCRVLRRKPVN